jgi:type I restriction-modification system DNA methylase subunit
MQHELDILEKKSYSTFSVDENFQTPMDVCDYMANMVPKDCNVVFEPTPGLGNIVHALEKLGFEVVTADDFFLHDWKQKYPCIVMNPPFSSKSGFLENAPVNSETKGMKLGFYILKQCMGMSDRVIALMPWYTISDSDVRMRYLKEFGIKSLTALPRKTFQYARIQTVIIELEKGYKGETIFRTLNF